MAVKLIGTSELPNNSIARVMKDLPICIPAEREITLLKQVLIQISNLTKGSTFLSGHIICMKVQRVCEDTFNVTGH